VGVLLKTSIILPTYNERENIEKLIMLIVSKTPYPFEVIVVDDDSPDKTWEIVEEMQGNIKNIKLLRRINARGLASAIRDGVSSSTGDIIVWMDCDFSHPPELVPKLVEVLTSGGYDIAVASRFVKGGEMRYSITRVLASRLINLLATAFLNHSIRDYTSGFLAVKRKVFSQLRISGDYGEYCIDFLYRAKRKGLKVREVPYAYMPRKIGQTKTSPTILKLLKFGVRYISTILKLGLI
jgi:dolichol-phosphate mannosyltransferase